MNLGEAAHACLKELLVDVGLDRVTVERNPEEDEDCGSNWCLDGYHAFTLYRDEFSVAIDVPRAPPEEVRDSMIRFYVNGSSWMWKYAVDQVRCALAGDWDEWR